MKSILAEDLTHLNDVIIELPPFTDLKSKDNIKQVLDLFLKDIYEEKPKELFDAFNSKLSERMQATFFQNYGIDKDYADNIIGGVKPDIAYQLEKLFQNKGSNGIFKMLALLLESIFRRINFYNVEVYKTKNLKKEGGYLYNYGLKPIYITDENILITEPDININKTRKYLMDLKNFEEYTIWPVPTNLVYIQFSIGTDLIDNLEVFLDGVRAYASTYLSGIYFNYLSTIEDTEDIEKIEARDLELIISFFTMNMIKMRNPDWKIDSSIRIGSNLCNFSSGEFVQLETETDEEYTSRILFQQDEKCSFMHSMAILFKDYNSADYSDSAEMDPLKRRWQFFLKAQETSEICYSSLIELNAIIEKRYPRMYEDYWAALLSEDKANICDFYLKMYSIFINGSQSSFNQPINKACFKDYDQELPIASYLWKKEDTVLATTPSFEYIPDHIGADTLTLTVSNTDGFISSDTVTLLITEDGEATPSVAIDRDSIVRINSTVQIHAKAEAIPGELIEGYEWRLDEELIGSYTDERPLFMAQRIKNVNISFDVTEVKDYKLELKVWDSTGNVNYNSVTVRSIKETAPPELYPQAYAGPNLRAVKDQPIIINGSGKDLEIIKIHNTEWIINYIDVLFGSLFLTQEFITHFFNPVMDLFQVYFFPVELDYVADLIHRVKIKNKWNAVSTQERVKNQVLLRKTSIQTPIRGLDWQKFQLQIAIKYSDIYQKDFAKPMPIVYINEGKFYKEGQINRRVLTQPREYLIVEDRISTSKFR